MNDDEARFSMGVVPLMREGVRTLIAHRSLVGGFVDCNGQEIVLRIFAQAG